jgi:hypothetical protein
MKGAPMETKNVLKGMIKLNQTFFDNAFDLSVQVQDQAEKLGDTLLDQAGLSSSEYRKSYDTWITAYKSGRSSFKTFIDEGFRNAESVLS